MFAKSKITQSMIDAVNTVLGEEPSTENQKEIINEAGAPIKEPTATGMRVYGRNYGNSAKAKQDQTKSSVDDLKGPKDKEVKEELKGNQDKIDANKNDKIDAQDFEILRKKKVKEDMQFAKKLLETQQAKSPAKNTDVADKSYLKDLGKKPTVKSDLKNLGRFLTGKKETNEEVVDEALNPDNKTVDTLTGRKKVPASFDNQHLSAKVELKAEETEEQLDEMINEVLSKDATAGDWIHDFVHSDNPKFAGKSKAERKKMALGAYYAKQNEEAKPSDSWKKETPWMKSKGDVTDKSGAVHTPMSRARDLARSAFKKIQKETMMGKAGTTSESKKKW